MKAAYARAGWDSVQGYQGWLNVARTPYRSATHGSRYVNNYVDAQGDYRYARYEDGGMMPQGTTIAKDSFVVRPDGKVAVGPLFVMRKMGPGFSEETGNWRYTMIMPNGKVAGTTGGRNSQAMQFCNDCHMAMQDQDYLFFLPEEFRK